MKRQGEEPAKARTDVQCAYGTDACSAPYPSTGRPPQWSHCGWLVCLLLGTVGPVGAQSVLWEQFDPLVVSAATTGSMRYEVKIAGSPTRVELKPEVGFAAALPNEIELYDDGSQGDRIPGDGIYTALLQAEDIVDALAVDDVQRVFVGFLHVIGASTTRRINVFADVYADSLGQWAIQRLSPDMQATKRLVNIYDPAFFAFYDLTRITNEFYRWFADDYDFLNIIFTPSPLQNRTHWTIKNDVEGIGKTVGLDYTATYGSAGRLQGINRFPIPTFFDGAGKGFVHETGHQWISSLDFQPFLSGVPHWPLSSMASSVMGFSIGGFGGQGGTFPCHVVSEDGAVRLFPSGGSLGPTGVAFNSLDLYLMGLIGPDAVGEHIVLVNQDWREVMSQCDGSVYQDPVIQVTAQDVVDEVGLRRPDVTQSQKHFRVATILVSGNGLLSAEAMWLYSWLAQRAELRTTVPIHEGFQKTLGQPFYVATGGRAFLDTTVGGNSILFPPRDEVLDFFLNLENEYRDTLGRQRNNPGFVDAEGSAVWFLEWLRHVLNGCSTTDSTEQVLGQIQGLVLQPDCSVVLPGNVNFPPRNESLEFLNTLEMTYENELRRVPQLSYIDLEGRAVWLQEYLRYRVSGCNNQQAPDWIFQQIRGGASAPQC